MTSQRHLVRLHHLYALGTRWDWVSVTMGGSMFRLCVKFKLIV